MEDPDRSDAWSTTAALDGEAGRGAGVVAPKYPPPVFPEPPAAYVALPPLGDTPDHLDFCLFSVDIRQGARVTYPLAAAVDDALLAAAEAAAAAAAAAADGVEDDMEEDPDPDAFVVPDPRVPCTAYLTGHTATGAKVGLSLPWRPAFQVEVVPADASPDAVDKAKAALHDAVRTAGEELDAANGGVTRRPAGGLDVAWHVAARFKGWVSTPGKPLVRRRFWFAEVSAPNEAVARWVAGFLRRWRPREPGPHRRWGAGAAAAAPVAGPYADAVHEDGIDPEQAFVDAHGLTPSGWVRVARGALVTVPDTARELLVHYEFRVTPPRGRPSWWAGATHHRPFTAMDTVATVPSLVVAAIDGEMSSGAPGRFPQASRPDNPVVTISVVFSYAGGDAPGRPAGAVFERHAFVLAAPEHVAPIPGVLVHAGFPTEGAMIAAVRDLLFVHRHTDLVTGHNIVKFDMHYFGVRAEAAGPSGARFSRFGVLLRERLPIKLKRLTSSAFGSNNLHLLFGAGFAYVDSMLLCKVHPKKLRENTLAAACAAFLGPGGGAKFDMPYDDIPVIAGGTDPAAWAALAGYCVQDSELVQRLLTAWDTVRDLIAQSRVINIPLAVNVLCGQQQRVRDSVMRKARQSAMVMNGVNVRRRRRWAAEEEAAEDDTATGGFVLDNVAGFHDVPVVVLDFASLYPSVQRSRGLCWSTQVSDDEWARLSPGDRTLLGIETYVTATGTYRFATNVEGVFPAQLRDLLVARGAAKKKMAAAGRAKDAAEAAAAAARAALVAVVQARAQGDASADDELAAREAAANADLEAALAASAAAAAAYLNADAEQKSTKIVMNSGYGTANAAEDSGVMPCKAVGTVTCWVGAELNRAAKAFVEREFGATVLYGDTGAEAPSSRAVVPLRCCTVPT
jgi:DNA polymerase elongation subunit (family B)